MAILVTGGAGYIGSHVVKELLRSGYEPITLDNLQQGHKQAVTGGEFIEGSFGDKQLLRSIFDQYQVEAVVHLAANCLVGEAEEKPLTYYHNNLVNSLRLLEVMEEQEVNKIVFSSSAAVYGDLNRDKIPITEEAPKNPTNAYGRSKLFLEKIMHDQSRAKDLSSVSLRYFNAAGADQSGKIGEDHDPETHLIPLVLNTALGQRQRLTIYGADYETKDGTCVRDYVHVTDLAQAHLLALDALKQSKVEIEAYNLGSGTGYSVQEVIETARQVTGKEIETKTGDKRAGDPPVLVASANKIKCELGWQPRYQSLEQIIETAWNWHQSHPHGFEQ